MEKPLITIGITCFNAEDTIERALQSALDQDWEHTEIVIVDDFSTDGSVRVIEPYLEKFSNIKLVRHTQNRGCPTARNTVMHTATGEYLAFWDDDDVSEPNRLSAQYERIIGHEEQDAIIICHCGRTVMPVDGQGAKREIGGLQYIPSGKNPYTMMDHLLLGERRGEYPQGGFGTCVLMARTRDLAKIGDFDVNCFRAQDREYLIRASLMGAHFVSVDAPLILQYVTGGVDKRTSRFVDSYTYIVRKYKNHLKGRGLYPYALLMAYAAAHEYVGNKWRFKLLRSLSKRVRLLTKLFSSNTTATDKVR